MKLDTDSLAHTKWECKYHIVFSPKYRRKMIYNQYRESLQEIIRTLCKYKGGRNTGRAYDAGSRSPGAEYSAEDKRVKLHGISEREKRLDDV